MTKIDDNYKDIIKQEPFLMILRSEIAICEENGLRDDPLIIKAKKPIDKKGLVMTKIDNNCEYFDYYERFLEMLRHEILMCHEEGKLKDKLLIIKAMDLIFDKRCFKPFYNDILSKMDNKFSTVKLYK